MKRLVRSVRATTLIFGLATASTALAQTEPPKFDTAPTAADLKPSDATVWKANIQAGLIRIAGNAQSLALSGSGAAGFKKGYDALDLLVQGDYATAETSSVVGGPLDGEKISADDWLGKLRYQRYLTPNNTLFASFQANGDRLAGIDYRLEPQLGYARIFISSDVQTLRGEIGYDYAYEHYLPGTVPLSDDFHSGRLFVFYENKFTPYASFSEGAEYIQAVNKIYHYRINSLTSLSSTISKTVALKLNFSLLYNHDPPDRPPPNLGKFGPLDTTLQAVVAVTLL